MVEINIHSRAHLASELHKFFVELLSSEVIDLKKIEEIDSYVNSYIEKYHKMTSNRIRKVSGDVYVTEKFDKSRENILKMGFPISYDDGISLSFIVGNDLFSFYPISGIYEVNTEIEGIGFKSLEKRIHESI